MLGQVETHVHVYGKYEDFAELTQTLMQRMVNKNKELIFVLAKN